MYRTLLNILFILCFVQHAFCQVKKAVVKPPVRLVSSPFANIKDDPSPVKYIQLKKDTPVFVPKNYYIQKIEDEANSNDSIGYILQAKSGNKQRIAFSNGTVNCVKEFFDFKVAKDTTLYPLVFVLKKIALSEEKSNDFYRNGTFKYSYSFEYRYTDKSLPIGGENGSFTYTTHVTQNRHLDSNITQAFIFNLQDIDTNLGEAISNHPAFCKGVNTIINYKTVNNYASDTIFFDGQQELTWDDFASTSTGGDNYFMPFIDLLFIPKAGYKNGKVQLDIETGAYFVKSRSWVGKKLMNAQMLRHLQYRFKLTWLESIKLKKKIEAASLSCSNYQDEVRDLVYAGTKQLQKIMEEYAAQTLTGTNKNEQIRWQHLIDSEIEDVEKNK